MFKMGSVRKNGNKIAFNLNKYPKVRIIASCNAQKRK